MISAGLYPLEPFGAGVPARYQTVRTEHVDRVSRYCVHEEVKTVSIGFEAGGFGRTGRHSGILLGKRRIKRRLTAKRTSLGDDSLVTDT